MDGELLDAPDLPAGDPCLGETKSSPQHEQ